MTNFEKYQKELAKIAVEAGEFGLKNGKPVRCISIECRKCNWEKDQCYHSAKEWVNQEYNE